MKSPPAARAAVALAGVLLPALCIPAALATPHERPAAAVTEYVSQLREAARLAGQAASSTTWLVTHSAKRCPQVAPAAQQLVAASNAAGAAFQRYRNAKTRYGTREEIELIATVALKLREARAALAAVAGEPAQPPSGGERQAAERDVGLFRTVIALEIEDRLGVEGLADVLTAKGLRGIKDKVVSQLHGRVRARAEAELRRLTGLRIRLDVPLKRQIRDFMEAELSRLLGKLTISAGPAGIVISLVAGRILNPGRLVDIAARALRELLRQKGHVAERTKTSLAGLEAVRRELNALGPDAPLDKVRGVVRRGQRALGGTRFLEGDLAKARQDALLAELRAAKTRLEQTIKRTTFRFLLDSQLVGEDFGVAVAFSSKTRSEAERLAKKLGCSVTAPPPAKPGAPPGGTSKPPTAAVCVPASIRMEYFSSLGAKLGEYDARLQGLVNVDEYNAKCLWVATGPTDEAFVAFIGYTPPGVQGRLPAGNCDGRRPDSPPFYQSRKRYLTVSGGNRKSFQNAVGGNEAVLKKVLAAAEAAGVGRACG